MQLLPAVLHCHANATAGIPPKATLRELWDAQPAIENVTYRHLLSMRGGIKDYYYDSTQWHCKPRHSPATSRRPASGPCSNWRGSDKTVMGSTRDVEPLEFLVHQDHGFLFAPGATGVVPPGVPGAGQTVARGALLDERICARAASPSPARSASTTGRARPARLGLGRQAPRRRRRRLLRAGHRSDARQGGEQARPHAGRRRRPLVEISNHSCLNSYTGGNIGAAPREVARFTAAVFGPGNALLSPASVAELVTLHPLTDGFAAYGLAYGLGLEAMWTTLPNGTVAAIPNVVCGKLGWALGHAGLDYGSGSTLANYFTDMGLGISFAMTSAYGEGSGLAGMNCSLPFGAQPARRTSRSTTS